MRALVISGGGSKGAYAGGVAQHLIEKQSRSYDLLLGSSTGSLLIPHLSLGKISKLHHIYTNVNQHSIFSLNPFVTKKRDNREYVTINHFNMLVQFLKKKRTFGESKNLRKTIRKDFSKKEFFEAKKLAKDIVVTVSNLTKNQVEYKSINDYNYDEFCNWVWISCNYVPFMSLVTLDGCEYADGGFGCLVPIREAIRRGATEVDAIILESENLEQNNILGKNPFSLMVNLFGFMWDQVRYHNVVEGQLAAINKEVKLNLYYTPSRLTENSLIFDKKLMSKWWQQGFDYAANKYAESLNEK
ncbi:MAG TPA: patatin-like phospholipase family protein [Flavobacteriaceae bacterium]|nr:patatin-like phospholipase family protein [Flavobacteriaceae bacterium]